MRTYRVMSPTLDPESAWRLAKAEANACGADRVSLEGVTWDSKKETFIYTFRLEKC